MTIVNKHDSTKYNNFDWNILIEDYKLGLTTRQLSEKYNISRPTIKRHFALNNFKANHTPKYKTCSEHSNWKGGKTF